MTAPDRSLADLLARRLELVMQLSQASSAMQRLQQRRAGAEMDVMRCELGLGGGPAEEVAQELLEARRRIEDADRGMEQCEAEIAEAERSLDETDREIEASAGR